MGSHRIEGTGRGKVKSGCRTCKIRKVKCDEGRPACHRCVSTGRTCDGYGIWGGGNNVYLRRQHLHSSENSRIHPQPCLPVFALVLSAEEKEHFEWFRCRTSVKLPGSFVSGFWTVLLVQASLNEAAVLHAILALSSVHKRGTIHAQDQLNNAHAPCKREQFALRHYLKAIGNLQSHLSIKDRASFRVALIACVVFICLESLRGHFETAQTHLQNGLKMLKEAQMHSNEDSGILQFKTYRDPADDWIIEAFSRLQLQVELFKHTHQHSGLILQAACLETEGLGFHTINEAWKELAQLLNRIFHLTNQSRQQTAHDYESVGHSFVPLERQQRILSELTRWLEKYEAFERATNGRGSPEEEKCYQLLHVYYTMACIMAATSLRPGNESGFDCHTNLFVLLIEQLTALGRISLANDLSNAQSAKVKEMSRSVADMGWIPPLYYTAVKCRVHQIRVHAIRLLESTPHREGIWDARTAAFVARKAMEIEEMNFYKGHDTANDLPLPDHPGLYDLSLPTLPESCRIRDIEMVLQGAPTDKVLLFCKQRIDGTDHRVLLSQYIVSLERWVEGTC